MNDAITSPLLYFTEDGGGGSVRYIDNRALAHKKGVWGGGGGYSKSAKRTSTLIIALIGVTRYDDGGGL